MASNHLNDQQQTIVELLIGERFYAFGTAGVAKRCHGDTDLLSYVATISDRDVERVLAQVKTILKHSKRGAKIILDG